MASKEFEFFVKANLSKYEGKYVAIIDDKIVASGDDAKEVWLIAKKKHPTKMPVLAKVPKAEALVLASASKHLNFLIPFHLS